MGKKCVQPSNKTRITLCRSLTYPQIAAAFLLSVGKSGTQSKALLSQIHRRSSTPKQMVNKVLYTVSTTPITTTICLKNKRQLITVPYKV